MLIRDMIDRCASNFPTKTAFICGQQVVSWATIADRSERFAAALQTFGVGKGTTVAILSQESIEVYEHFRLCEGRCRSDRA